MTVAAVLNAQSPPCGRQGGLVVLLDTGRERLCSGCGQRVTLLRPPANFTQRATTMTAPITDPMMPDGCNAP